MRQCKHLVSIYQVHFNHFLLGNLYVANVGDCRGLLCKIDADGVLRVMQLTVDHDLTNEDELLRLSHTGLDVEKLHQSI